MAASLQLSQLRDKVILVDFWATWCPYCRYEMPEMPSFYRDWHSRGFEILALSVEDKPTLAAAFVKKKGNTFPAGIASAEIQQALGGVSTVPKSFIVDKHGVIRQKISGQVYYSRLEGLAAPLLKN